MTTQDGGKVVSITHRPPLPPRKYSWCSFLLEAEWTPGPKCDRKDFMSMKYSNGVEPATCLLVAQHLNPCATAVPKLLYVLSESHSDKLHPLFSSVFYTFFLCRIHPRDCFHCCKSEVQLGTKYYFLCITTLYAISVQLLKAQNLFCIHSGSKKLNLVKFHNFAFLLRLSTILENTYINIQ